MKKCIALLCVLTLVIGICAVSAVNAGAVDAARTAVDVKSGNEVTYILKLSGVELPIIGCDYSIYYDSSILEVESVADFNDKTNEDEWDGLINPALDGEVRGNWSILSGVKFADERNFITVKFKAKADGTSDISYFIRYMYDNNIFNSDSKPQITEYKFTCDVNVDGDTVLEDAQPELNVDEPQTSGLFVNSVTGDSSDADADIPGTVVKKTADSNNAVSGSKSENEVGGNDSAGGNGGNSVSGGNASGGSGNASGGNSVSGGSSSGGAVSATAAPAATTAEGYYITATDAEGKVTATSDEAPVVTTAGTDNGGKSGGSSPVIWIIIALVVLAGGGAAAYFVSKKKSAGAAPADNADAAPAQETAAEADSSADKKDE